MKELYEYQSSVNNRKDTGEKEKREHGNPNEAGQPKMSTFIKVKGETPNARFTL